MLFPLSSIEMDVLKKLDEDRGFETRVIAKKLVILARSERSKSMTVRGVLLRLKKMRMVDYLDDEKPVCWIRTPRGTKYLADNGYLSDEKEEENITC